MNMMQRVVKWCAIALAVFLIFLIGSGILAGVSVLGLLAWGDEAKITNSEMSLVADYVGNEVTELDINVKATNLQIKVVEGKDSVRVETNNQYIETWVGNGKLSVIEKSHGVFGWGGTGDVVIYVRKGTKFGGVEIVSEPPS